MHRFYLAPEDCRDSLLRIEGEEAHHALHVMRLRAGQRAVVLDGAGGECLCEVRACGRDDLELSVKQRSNQPRPQSAVTLVQAIPKAKGMEFIIQKATELGVRRVVPVLSDRTVPHHEEQQETGKTAKWKRAAVEAIKQCGSAWLPEIESPISLAGFLARREVPDLALIASLQPGARHPRECLEAYRTEHGGAPAVIQAWVGPEGDFTPAEMNAIQSAGAVGITLGPLVLRSETAAVYVLSVLSYELQWMRAPG